MRILVLGAGGFIGGRIVAELISRGHVVVCAGRNPGTLQQRFPECAAIHADLISDTMDDWVTRLAGLDGVVNAAGILRGALDRVHEQGPIALYQACSADGVTRVVQISALGAGQQPGSRFLATKHSADLQMRRLADDAGLHGWCVLRPSLVIGRGGASTQLFSSLAAMPWPLRLANGDWVVQPIHVADVACAVASLLESQRTPRVLDAVGPEAMTTDTLTRILRDWLGLPPRRFLGLPLAWIRFGAWAGNRLPAAQLTCETLSMLAHGNIADAAPLAAVLGRVPRRLDHALAREPSVAGDRWIARMVPLRNLLRGCLAAIWIGSGLASFALSTERATALLIRMTSDIPTALALTWGGAALDIALGTALVVRSVRRRVLQVQLVVMLFYTALASIALPELWADPFGPLLKNFAVLAAIVTLLAVED